MIALFNICLTSIKSEYGIEREGKQGKEIFQDQEINYSSGKKSNNYEKNSLSGGSQEPV